MCLLTKSVQLFLFEVIQGEKARVPAVWDLGKCSLLARTNNEVVPKQEAQTQLVRECNVICADVNRCVDEVRILWPGAFAEHTWSWCAIDGAEGLRGGDLSFCALTLMLL